MINISRKTYIFLARVFLSVSVLLISGFPVQAYEGQYSAFNDQYGARSSINAGFRLSIPFGPTKRTEDKIKYGLQMSLRREFSNSTGWNNNGHMSAQQIYNADIMSLNFSENGFKGLSFAGRQAFNYKNGVLKAAESSNDGDRVSSGLTTGLLIGAGVILIGVGGLAIYVDSLPPD